MDQRAPRQPGIPRDRAFDASFALRFEGYDFIKNRCERYGSDIFTTRIMLRKATCLMGEDAARMFYTGDHFTRVGAMPVTTLKLLQDYDSVQMLDGAAMRHRKQMFLSLVSPQSVALLAALARAEWRAGLAAWEGSDEIVLFDEVRELLCRAVCKWAGIELTDRELKLRNREFGAMIEGSGSVGPRAWWGLLLRSRNERWIREVLRRIRSGELACADGAPAKIIAMHRDENGDRLPLKAAGVELINVLRASVAVARYIVFAALMLHERPDTAKRLREGDAAYAEAFAQEVRRVSPFFAFIGGRVKEAFDWRGKTFTKGEWVLLDLYGTCRDPRSHRAATNFDPDRFLRGEVSQFAFIPQGGGDVRSGHRCPGESITVALIRVGALMLAQEMRYEVPEQDLRVKLSRIPALPRSGFVIRNVRRVEPAKAKDEVVPLAST